MKLEVGTEIAELYYGKILSIKKVTRVTATRAYIKIGNGHESTFRIEAPEGGVREFSPAKWSASSYRVATEKDHAELKLALSIQKLKNTEWAKLPEETIFKITKILNEAK